METKDIVDVFSMQADPLELGIGRTKEGWDVGKALSEALSASMASVNDDGFSATECSNCHVILASEYFTAGCPNCGCKDTQKIEVERGLSNDKIRKN